MKFEDALSICEERKNGNDYIRDASSQSYSIMFKNFKLMFLDPQTPNYIYRNHWKDELYQPIIDMIRVCGGKFNPKNLLDKMKENSEEDFKRLLKETKSKYSSIISEKEIIKNKYNIISSAFKIYSDVVNIIYNNYNKDLEEQQEQQELARDYVNKLYP